jgi:hypothetical protein
MYKITLLAIALCTVCTGFTQTVAKPVVQEWLFHTDTANNVTVKYPANWTLKVTNKTAVFMLTSPNENDKDNFRENINVIVKELPNGGEGVQMQDIVTAVESKIPTAVDNFKLYYSKTIKWLGTDAREVSYGGNNKTGGLAINFIQRIAMNKGRLVLATYTSEGGREDVFKESALKIISSITCN